MTLEIFPSYSLVLVLASVGDVNSWIPWTLKAQLFQYSTRLEDPVIQSLLSYCILYPENTKQNLEMFWVIPLKINLEKLCAIKLGPCSISRYISEIIEAFVRVCCGEDLLTPAVLNIPRSSPHLQLYLGPGIYSRARVLSPRYFWEVTQTCRLKKLLIQENLVKICVGDF